MRQNRNDDGAQVARRGRASAAGETALAQGAAAFERAGFADPAFVLRWPDIAGTEVARVAQPVKLQEGPDGATLTLRCTPGAAVLLQHETRALIQRINGYLGQRRVSRLRLVTGTSLPRDSLPSHPLLGQTAEYPGSAASLKEALARLGGRRRKRPAGGN